MEYLLKLNKSQLEAVKNTEGFLRVIAGAGSGKTKLLVSRYAYLVKEYGIDSANILCVTFTNKAAGEMKRRIRALIGDSYDTSLICTYHGFCVRVLREDVEKIFFPKEFQIIDTTQQKNILSEIYQKFELKLDYGSFEKMVRQIELYKSTNRDYVNNMCCTDKCQIMKDVHSLDDKIIEEYLQIQKHLYALDFSDLIYFTLNVFHRCIDVLKKWQDRLNYIQVDEFQDSSSTEMELIDLLCAKHENLMIVGDPDQNIYEWRGSDVKLLVDFDKTHTPTRTIFLNQNYRSTPQILKCANTLIEKNELRLKKDLFTRNDSGAEVFHYHSKNEYSEAGCITDVISDLRKKTGCDYSDFAVLYRSGFLSRIIEKKFTEEGIPYEIFNGVKFYHRMEIQDIMAYLRLIVFDDDVSLKRIINKPRRRFGRMKLQALQQLQKNCSLYETLKQNLSSSAFKGSGAKEFIYIIDTLRQYAKDLYVSEMVQKICEMSGYEKYIRELGDMERFENLSEFKRIAGEYETNLGESISLKEFINHISLQSEDENEKEADTVKFMTIHAAKGLEFPNVFVLGLSEGIFPSSKSIEERKQLGLEEERRLCYVAITRAEKRLYLLDSEGFLQNGKVKLPSRFLKEIGEENYTRIGAISKEVQEASDMKSAKNDYSYNDEPVLKNIGDRVSHPAFGEGEIIGYEKNKNSYRIKFDKLNSERIVSVLFFSKERKLPVIPSSQEESSPPSVPVDISLPFEEIPSPPMPADIPSPFEENPSPSAPVDIPLPLEKKPSPSVPADIPLPFEEKAPPVVSSDIRKPTKSEEEQDEEIAKKLNKILEEIKARADRKESLHKPSDIPEGYKKIEEKRVPEQKSAGGGAPPENRPQNKAPEQADAPKRNINPENLWERDDVPKTGWHCIGVTDLQAPVGICGMCGHQVIRYVHHMVHPQFHQIDAGCICAGKMEGNIERAKQRERDFKNKEARKESFMSRKWKNSKNNNSYLKIKDHLIVLYYSPEYKNWKYSLDNKFCEEVFRTKAEAKSAAFEALEKVIHR